MSHTNSTSTAGDVWGKVLDTLRDAGYTIKPNPSSPRHWFWWDAQEEVGSIAPSHDEAALAAMRHMREKKGGNQ